MLIVPIVEMSCLINTKSPLSALFARNSYFVFRGREQNLI